MLLGDLLKDIPGIISTQGNLDIEIGALILNSREKTANGLFFCISGARFDAHEFAAQAVGNGCTALVVSHY
ncbi:MAG: UDP-N-acetylmuramoyl-L-alanyl-D-glutamate--2,6-diaminopimelate ligase, partial [Eubacteriales bacterium]|nr:UDP-N-acetylmuramoyl-L-alanyl-D-glutamate--2,6-diaminopimelate ligase [Eubacteriales bacterium]